jgi:hypothetical protein
MRKTRRIFFDGVRTIGNNIKRLTVNISIKPIILKRIILKSMLFKRKHESLGISGFDFLTFLLFRRDFKYLDNLGNLGIRNN